MGSYKSKLLLAALAYSFASIGNAALVGYTNPADFLANLPGAANILDFESLPAGTSTIADGDTIDGITFNYNFGGVAMEVTDGNQFGGGGPFATTSGSNFLGTDDLDVFQDGDDFSLGLAPVNAIGMFFITADDMFDGDIMLSVGSESVGLSLLDAGADLGDGGIPFFLGLIDTQNSFSSALITADGGPGGPFFLYNVDDIITSVVPIPGAIWLFMSGLLGIFVAKREVS